MQIGIIGLGRMGDNIGRRLMKPGHHRALFDTNATSQGHPAAAAE